MSKKSLPPRAKRMNRNARIQSARIWLQKYNGKNIASGYRKHFGVDWACAFKELEILGVKLDPEYVKKVLESIVQQHKKTSKKRSSKSEQEIIEQDENFACIAGYTSGGFPYGITWEEWNEAKNQDTKKREPRPCTTGQDESVTFF